MSALTTEGYVMIKEYDEDAKMWKDLGDNRIVGEKYVDLFGRSVSLNAKGNILAVGAPMNNENGESSGQTRVYKNISGTWTQIGNSINGEYHKESGMSVSLNADGTIVAIGSPVSDGMNNSVKDYVKIYRYKNDTWNQLGGTINEAEAYSWFGYSVSLSTDGSTVAVGAFANDVNGEHSGQTRVYTYGENLGVGDIFLPGIKIYPNPANNTLYIEYNKNSVDAYGDVRIEFYDIAGRKVMDIPHSADKIDISSLRKGTYIVKISTSRGIVREKLNVAR